MTDTRTGARRTMKITRRRKVRDGDGIWVSRPSISHGGLVAYMHESTVLEKIIIYSSAGVRAGGGLKIGNRPRPTLCGGIRCSAGRVADDSVQEIENPAKHYTGVGCPHNDVPVRRRGLSACAATFGSVGATALSGARPRHLRAHGQRVLQTTLYFTTGILPQILRAGGGLCLTTTHGRVWRAAGARGRVSETNRHSDRSICPLCTFALCP